MRHSDTVRKLSSLLSLLGETNDTLRDLILEKLADVICRYSELLAHTDCFSDLEVGTVEHMCIALLLCKKRQLSTYVFVCCYGRRDS